MPLFPAKFKATLRYFETVTLNSTSGAVGSYVFSTNGLYDPNITGTGHQPAGFDQMMLSYEHYTVLRSRMQAIYHNNTSGAAPTAAVSVNASSTAITDIAQIMEAGFAQVEHLSYNNGTMGIKKIEIGCEISKFHGLRDLLDNDDYRGSISANPAEQSYYILQLWDTELVTNSSAVDVLIEYEAVFTEPKKITSSMLLKHREEESRSEVKTGELSGLDGWGRPTCCHNSPCAAVMALAPPKGHR